MAIDAFLPDRSLTSRHVDSYRGVAAVDPAHRITPLYGEHPQTTTGAYPESQWPPLTLIDGEAESRPTSRDVFENYLEMRIAAGFAEKTKGADLKVIQEDVRNWLATNHPEIGQKCSFTDYTTYSREMVDSRLGILGRYLRQKHKNSISDFEFDATELFIESAFAMYEDKNAINFDRDGMAAFIVQPRMSRNRTDYGHEIEGLIGLLRYVPNELRADLMVGLPPFIAETYRPHPKTGRRGYLIVTPVTENLQADLASVSTGDAKHAVENMVNDAVDFALNRLGVDLVGLGGRLPGATSLGKSIQERFGDQVLYRTGHAGTIYIAKQIIEQYGQQYFDTDRALRIGAIGLGAIGGPAAEIFAETSEYPISAFDTSARRMAAYTERNERLVAAPDIDTVLSESDVVFAAVTNAIRLKGKGITNRMIVDDSQPRAFDTEDVANSGNVLVEVVAEDTSNRVQRMGFDYGTLPDGFRHLYGCEAEVMALAGEREDLIAGGMDPKEARRAIEEYSIDGVVTLENVHAIGRLLERRGIRPAAPQAGGRLVQLTSNTA